MAASKGKITQVIGPVVDVRFNLEGGELPNILDGLTVVKPSGEVVILECQQHVGEDTVRTIAMDSSEGLTRGLEVLANGQPITMPVGDQIKGRTFNVIGGAIDGLGEVDHKGGRPIHREAPKFEDLSTAT